MKQTEPNYGLVYVHCSICGELLLISHDHADRDLTAHKNEDDNRLRDEYEKKKR